jgi:hypothetical protein
MSVILCMIDVARLFSGVFVVFSCFFFFFFSLFLSLFAQVVLYSVGCDPSFGAGLDSKSKVEPFCQCSELGHGPSVWERAPRHGRSSQHARAVSEASERTRR